MDERALSVGMAFAVNRTFAFSLQKVVHTTPFCSADNRWSDVLSTVQKFVCGRGYLRAADVSSFCTLADGVVVEMIYCTNNGR